MNFITEMQGQEIQVELKYCERCGGLWVRPQGSGGVYCASCRVFLSSMPDPGEPPPRKARRRKARVGKAKRATEDRQSPAHIDCLQGVAAMEVWS